MYVINGSNRFSPCKKNVLYRNLKTLIYFEKFLDTGPKKDFGK